MKVMRHRDLSAGGIMGVNVLLLLLLRLLSRAAGEGRGSITSLDISGVELQR